MMVFKDLNGNIILDGCDEKVSPNLGDKVTINKVKYVVTDVEIQLNTSGRFENIIVTVNKYN